MKAAAKRGYKTLKIAYFDRKTGKRVRRPVTVLADPRQAFVETYNKQGLDLVAKAIG